MGCTVRAFYIRPIDSPAILPCARMVTVLLSHRRARADLGFKDWSANASPCGSGGAGFDPFYAAHSRVLAPRCLVTIFVAFS